MFKKKPNIKNLAPLRSSDRRKVVDDIISTYQITTNESVEQPQEGHAQTTGIGQLRNSLLPDGALSAKFSTTVGADQKTVNGTIYVGSYGDDEQRILWVRVNDLTIPTVYTLWKYPGLVPLLHTPDIVLDKMRGGADLMTPGLANGPPFPSKAVKGAVIAIAGLNHPSVPVIVGRCAIDVAALQNVQGAKGHAVTSLHWHGDEIWNWSQHDRPGLAPPEEIDGWISSETEDTKLQETEAQLDDLGLGEEEDGGVSILTNEPKENEELADGLVARKAWETKDIDSAFRRAFLYSIYQAKQTSRSEPRHGVDLPIDQSKFMSNYILPYLPSFNSQDTDALQIKKTSWKNVKKFIKVLDKEQLLKSKERQGGEMVILDIDFDDQAFTSFQPYPLPKKETTSSTTATSSEVPSHDDSIGQTLKRLTLLKPHERLAPLLKAANASRADLYLSPELREIVKNYLEAENLINADNKRLVNIDPTLGDAILDPSNSMDAEVLRKGTIPRDTLLDRIVQKCCSPYYAITRNDQARDTVKAKAGQAPNIKITLETRSGNKTATKVSGLEFYHIRPALFKEELQKVCASSTTMGLLSGTSPKDNLQEIMLQGPQKDAVVKALERRGVRRDWVDYTDKTKKKK